MSKLLDSIEYPEDLKKLKLEELPKLAAEIRELIVNVVSKNPGHLSSNLGVVELTMALPLVISLLQRRMLRTCTGPGRFT